MKYEYHLNSALVKPNQESWQKLLALIPRINSQSAVTARHLMSLIGLLASTKKIVPEGSLHTRPLQWHHKENWKFPQQLDKLLSWTDFVIVPLDWWQNQQNVLKGTHLHPQEHNIQLFTDTSNKGWGAHLEQDSISGLWSDLEKSLRINILELKAVFFALKHFMSQYQNQTFLVAMDNSTVVAYINKQGRTQWKCAPCCGES